MSGGTFSKANRPIGSGTYFNFDVVAPPQVFPSIGSVVALGITHDWGPLETPTMVFSLQEFINVFGGDMSNPSPGLIAVYNALKGEGLPDFGGAGAVLVHRMGGTGALAATKVLNNTTPAPALTVTAKYPGIRGNEINITTQDHAGDSSLADFIVLDTTGTNSTVLEKYVYADTNITDLVAKINASSNYITATLTLTGVGLAPIVSTPLTGGNSGAALVAQDYTDALAVLEIFRFGVLAFANLTDSAIITSLKTWTIDQNAAGRRFFLVVGGALGENIGTASTRSDGLNDPDIINIGVGTVKDLDLLDVNGAPVVLSTAQLASRIAGIVAGRGMRYGLTFAKLAGLDMVAGPTVGDLLTAYDHGVMVLTRGSDAASTLRIEKGISTYTTTTDAARPKSIFSVPRYLSVMHALQTELVIWADDTIVGKTSVNDDTRAAVVARTLELLRDYQLLNAINSGYSAFVDPVPPAEDTDDFIAVVIAGTFGRSTEQVYFTAQLG